MTHESSVQMSLFEDPKLEYYRKWDRQYDEEKAKAEKAKAEDVRMLAFYKVVSVFVSVFVSVYVYVYLLNGSAFLEGIDWMMRNIPSRLAKFSF